ncbi:hypothetical protein OCAR_4793 [Afipia carboxidovorans OM5]|nr:hypothetical protein OCAR_4793 [Afipia carboxidovorans OM5]
MLRSFHADRVCGLHAPAGPANRNRRNKQLSQLPVHPSHLMETD